MILWFLAACVATDEPAPFETTETLQPRAVPPPAFFDERPERLVALGDIHGDWKAARQALKLAGVMNNDNEWIGGETWVVQTGDQLDRGDGEEKILELFEDLADQAHEAGGAFFSLLGNHEIMQVELDFRYVTDGGFEDFADTELLDPDALYDDFPTEQHGRVAAFRPGGEWATILSDHNVVLQVGDTVFVHGGVLPVHASHGLKKINNETRRWMRGQTPTIPWHVDGSDSVVWTRAYSDDEEPSDCAALEETLELLGADQMVVGHTVHDTINPDCNGKVWRIDVGMAAYYGGVPMALAFEGDQITVLE